MLLNLIKDLYTQTNLQIRLGKKLSASFQTRSGVRQGCILASALFCRAMDWIMARALDHRGIILSGDNFSDADYTVDASAMEYDPTNITKTLEKIEAASSELGLHISWAKMKVQNIGAGPPAADLSVKGQTVEGIQSFVCFANGSQSEQLRRMGIAPSNMGNLECIWRQLCLSIQTNMKAYICP